MPRQLGSRAPLSAPERSRKGQRGSRKALWHGGWPSGPMFAPVQPQGARDQGASRSPRRHVSATSALEGARDQGASMPRQLSSRAPLSGRERSRKGQRGSRKAPGTSGVPERTGRARRTRGQSEARWQTRAARALQRGSEKARRTLEEAVKGSSGVQSAPGILHPLSEICLGRQ